VLLPCKAAQHLGECDTRRYSMVGSHIGAILTSTGTVSDFDRAGLFGLIIADDGGVLLFNLRETPLALRSRFEIGRRVRFTKHESEPAARAVAVAPIDEWNDGGSSSETAAKV